MLNLFFTWSHYSYAFSKKIKTIPLSTGTLGNAGEALASFGFVEKIVAAVQDGGIGFSDLNLA